MKFDTVAAGTFCTVASLAAMCIYLSGFAHTPWSSDLLFLAMPIVCPLAYLAYLKSKRAGTVAQAVLYSFASFGGYHMIHAQCIRGDCFTQNIAAIIVAGMFAGAHMISMFLALVVMCFGVANVRRSRPVA